MALVRNPNDIRIAMLGMVEGNGHPYSWSAIINGGFDAEAMARCYPVIPQYLSAQPPGALGIPGARVTHVWSDDPADAAQVAKASLIENVVARPTDVTGQVDAVIIPTDIGAEHVARARPFIEAGLPIFIDKPLGDQEADLRQFVAWQGEGRAIMSSSCMRYAREFASLRERIREVGEPRIITMSMCKSWDRYGIHGLEGVYPFLEAGGWGSVTNSGGGASNIVHARHKSGVEVVILNANDLYGAFGHLNIYGTKGSLAAAFGDTFYAFKTQLEDFIGYLRSGRHPFEFAQTIELMKLVIAGIRSREQGGKRIFLGDTRA
jgi:predicted dehydrogenase